MKQFTPPIAKPFAITSFLVCTVLAIDPAQAVVINFESLTPRITTVVPSPYTESGFTLSDPALPGFTRNEFAVVGTQEANYTGSSAFYNNSIRATTRLAQVGNGAFTLLSIDVADLFNSGLGDPTLINFTGVRADNSTVTQSFTTDRNRGLETISFNNFTNLVSVDWNPAPTSSFQFDNINVVGNSVPAPSTAVPEPFTVLGTLFSAGYGIALKRKLVKAKLDREDIS